MTLIIKNTDSNSFLQFIETSYSFKDTMTIGYKVFDWINENKLILGEDYTFEGTTSVYFDNIDGSDKIKTIEFSHGIKIFDKELETAFRLKFSCRLIGD